MKKIISLVLSLLIAITISVPAFSGEFNDIKFSTDKEQIEDILKDKGIYEEDEDVVTVIEYNIHNSENSQSQSNEFNVIIDKDKIDAILKDKGIYEEGEDVVTVIEYRTKDLSDRQPLLGSDFYSKKIGTSTIIDSTPRYNNNYPSGSFQFNSQITTSWKMNNTLGLSVDVLSSSIGYTLNKNVIETWNYSSTNYSYPINVKAYLNFDKQYYDIYEKDDYVGRAMISREAGYTIKVTRQ